MGFRRIYSYGTWRRIEWEDGATDGMEWLSYVDKAWPEGKVAMHPVAMKHLYHEGKTNQAGYPYPGEAEAQYIREWLRQDPKFFAGGIPTGYYLIGAIGQTIFALDFVAWSYDSYMEWQLAQSGLMLFDDWKTDSDSREEGLFWSLDNEWDHRDP